MSTTNGPCCAHLQIRYRTAKVEYTGPDVPNPDPDSPNVGLRHGEMLTEGWWQCRDCETRFVPSLIEPIGSRPTTATTLSTNWGRCPNCESADMVAESPTLAKCPSCGWYRRSRKIGEMGMTISDGPDASPSPDFDAAKYATDHLRGYGAESKLAEAYLRLVKPVGGGAGGEPSTDTTLAELSELARKMEEFKAEYWQEDAALIRRAINALESAHSRNAQYREELDMLTDRLEELSRVIPLPDAEFDEHWPTIKQRAERVVADLKTADEKCARLDAEKQAVADGTVWPIGGIWICEAEGVPDAPYPDLQSALNAYLGEKPL